MKIAATVSRAYRMMLAIMLLSLAQWGQAQQCDALFPTPVAAHDPNASLIFYGGWISGVADQPLAARSITDRSWRPSSCETNACQITGVPAASAVLPDFQHASSAASIRVRWLRSVGFTGASRDFARLSVGSFGSLQLTPADQSWRIRRLSLSSGARLQLAPGDYWIEQLSLGSGARITALAGGTVRLFVGNSLSMGSGSRIGDSASPGSMLLVNWQDVRLAPTAELIASVYAQGDLRLGFFSQLHGDAAAARIVLDFRSRLQVLSEAARQQRDYGAFCTDDTPQPDTSAPQLTTTLVDGTRQEAATLVVSGSATDDRQLAEVRVDNLSTGEQQTASLTGDNYSASLALAFGANTIRITATDAAGNSATLQRQVQRVDLTAPHLSLQQPDDEDTTAASITITGQVSDGSDGSGLASITLVNAASPEQQITVTQDGNTFTAVVPLRFGDNPLTITATDQAGLSATLQKRVRRLDTVPPLLTLDNPASQTLAAPSVTLSGQASDAESGLAMLTVASDRGIDPQPLALVGGAFSGTVALAAGINQITVSATDQAGNVSSILITVVRPDQDGDGIADDIDPDRDGDGFSNAEEIARGTDPDDPNDFPDDIAPQLTVHNAAQQTVTSDAILITGQASDEQALASVVIVNDRFAGEFAGTVQGAGQFSINVPLRVGDNRLTVTATDASGNSTQRELDIQRLAPPRFEALAPANGSTLHDETVTLSGLVSSDAPAGELQLQVNGATVPLGDDNGAGYPFDLSMPLAMGVNRFDLLVSGAAGSDRRELLLNRLPEDPDSLPAPALTLLAPNDGQWFNGEQISLVGQVQSFAGRLSLTVNGQPVALIGDGITGTFRQSLLFPPGNDALSLHVVATDALGRSSQQTRTVYRDGTPPVISLDNELLPLPADNPVNSSPLWLSGTVSDPRLSSLLINDRAVSLQPDGEHRYRFRHPVPLAPGTTTVLLSAHDDAGNSRIAGYQLSLAESALLTPLLPVDGSRFISDGSAVLIDVAARLAGTADGAEAFAVLGGQRLPLQLEGTLISGQIPLPAELGRAELGLEVLHQGTLLAATSLTVEVINRAAAPLAVTLTPDAERPIRANAVLTFRFNRPINPAELTLSVRETLNGPGYRTDDAPGTDFTRAKGYELVPINRNLEPVPGDLELLADGRSLVFKAQRFFGFGSTLTIEVAYQDEPVLRTALPVEPLPTQASGLVADLFGDPIAGVRVQLGEWHTDTNDDGGWSLGFGEQAGRLPAGKQQLLINADGRVPMLGSRRLTVVIEAGRLNELGTVRVPQLDPDNGFATLRSGARTLLADGTIEIDLRNAQLRDSQGNSDVAVSLLWLPMELFNIPSPQMPPMFGVFVLQPEGLQVSGQLAMQLPAPDVRAVPFLQDSDPQDGDVLLVLGLNDDRTAMVPQAVARLAGNRMVLHGDWHGRWLDYLALTLVPEAALEPLANYLEGRGDWGQLSRALGGR